jgi:hypothetical protein
MSRRRAGGAGIVVQFLSVVLYFGVDADLSVLVVIGLNFSS